MQEAHVAMYLVRVSAIAMAASSAATAVALSCGSTHLAGLLLIPGVLADVLLVVAGIVASGPMH